MNFVEPATADEDKANLLKALAANTRLYCHETLRDVGKATDGSGLWK